MDSENSVHTAVIEAQALISEVREDLGRLREVSECGDLESRIDALQGSFNPYVNIESVPGARTPKWYSVDIDFGYGESQSKSRAIEISTDGAFVLNSMSCAFSITDSENSHYVDFSSTYTDVVLPRGRLIPTTTYTANALGAFQNLVYAQSTTPISTALLGPFTGPNELANVPEFSVGLELESLGIQLTERPIPSGFVYSADNPLYFSSLCYVDRGERLIVTARPDARVSLGGTFKLFLHGYQVLGDIDTKVLRRLR
jgi:hypothetical protein